jgi:hypothetical protein
MSEGRPQLASRGSYALRKLARHIGAARVRVKPINFQTEALPRSVPDNRWRTIDQNDLAGDVAKKRRTTFGSWAHQLKLPHLAEFKPMP